MKPNAFISATSARIRSSFNNRCWHSILYVRALIKFIGVRPHTKVGISIFIAAKRTSKKWIVLLSAMPGACKVGERFCIKRRF
jgi:hypothetical protein